MKTFILTQDGADNSVIVGAYETEQNAINAAYAWLNKNFDFGNGEVKLMKFDGDTGFNDETIVNIFINDELYDDHYFLMKEVEIA